MFHMFHTTWITNLIWTNSTRHWTDCPMHSWQDTRLHRLKHTVGPALPPDTHHRSANYDQKYTIGLITTFTIRKSHSRSVTTIRKHTIGPSLSSSVIHWHNYVPVSLNHHRICHICQLELVLLVVFVLVITTLLKPTLFESITSFITSSTSPVWSLITSSVIVVCYIFLQTFMVCRLFLHSDLAGGRSKV